MSGEGYIREEEGTGVVGEYGFYAKFSEKPLEGFQPVTGCGSRF